MSERWWWCRTHGTVEPDGVCRALDRLGPYETPEEARAWKDRAESREDSWAAADEAWAGPKDDWDREDEQWRRG